MPIISEIEGDLIKLFKSGKYDVAVHGCNCFCAMGAGIARQVAIELPQVYEADKATLKGYPTKLGDYSFYNYTRCRDSKKLTFINAYTQFRTASRKGEVVVNYDAIAKVFTKINEEFKGSFVGIPMIGAGLANGHWKAIETIINLTTPAINIELVKFKTK